MNSRLELRRLARDSIYNLIRQGLGVILAIIISILIARSLGTEARGVYTLAALLPEMLVTFLNLGIGSATIYFVGQGFHDPAWIIRQNTALAFWISIIAILIGLLLSFTAGSWLFPGVPIQYLLLGLLLIPISLLTAYLSTILQGLQDFKMFNLVLLVSQVILLVLVVVFVIWKKGGVFGAMIALIGSNLAGLVLLLAVLGERYSLGNFLTLKIDRGYIQRYFEYSLKAHLGNIITFLNYRADNFILDILTGPAQVGIYSISVGLGERLWIPSVAVGAVILPRIASLGQDEESRKQITPLTARAVLWLSLGMAVVTWVLSDWAVVFLYSSEYRASGLALRCLLPGIVMFNMTRILANDIAGRGKPGLNLAPSAASLAANIVANLILIPRWGAAGASLASTVSYSLLAFLTIFIYCRVAGVPWRQVLLINRSDLSLFVKAARLFTSTIRLRRNHASSPPGSL